MNPQDPNQQPQMQPPAGIPQPGVLPQPQMQPPAGIPQPAPQQAQPYSASAYQYAQNTMPAPQQAPVGAPQPGQVMPGNQPVAPTAQPVKPSNPNSTQNTLLVAEIRDGVVILNDGSFRSVILTKSINFDLMSPEEREAVEYAYQGFLNSLYYDIQIFIRSQKVDIRPYIEKLDKLRSEHENMLLSLMMEDYIDFISLLAQETNIMDKQFYIVVPYYPNIDAARTVDQSKKLLGGLFGKDKSQTIVTINEADLEKAKTELKNRVQNVMSGLQQLGVQSVPLSTEELIELYYNSYNPDTATRQHLQDFSQMTAPIISKGVGNAPQPFLDKEIY